MKKFCKLSLIIIISVSVIFSLSACFPFGGTAPEPTPTEDPNATPAPAKVSDIEFKMFDSSDFKISYQPKWHLYDRNEFNKNVKDEDIKKERETYADIWDKDEIRTLAIISETNLNDYLKGEKERAEVAELGPSITIDKLQLDSTEQEKFKLKEYVEDSVKDLKQSVGNFTFLKDFREIELKSGDKAYEFEYIGEVQGLPDIAVKQIISYKNGCIYIVIYMTTYQKYNDKNYTAVMAKTLESFELK